MAQEVLRALVEAQGGKEEAKGGERLRKTEGG